MSALLAGFVASRLFRIVVMGMAYGHHGQDECRTEEKGGQKKNRMPNRDPWFYETDWTKARILSRLTSRPRISMDSNRGGETRAPVMATRTGANAVFFL